ncbi:protein smoothened-like [Glossina fuscipes]|uniref:Protein smoothened-like n=1 Tax=Glossina fuscipes TaxID=7396 RepID=A0A9C5ZB61_9MUSC|nr:protein smoothened-like [Glossina fuscipes]XP_037896324.1 protein smoothened-like [Glossina fuscipes]
MKTKVAARTSKRQSGHHNHSKRSSNISKRNQKRKDFVATSERKTRGRRESSTSLESQVIALKKTIYASTSQKVGVFTKSSTKRTAEVTVNAGLEIPIPQTLMSF